MPDYLVSWEINISADTPEEAAQIALDYQRRQGSSATVFDVFSETGEKTRVDLSE